MLHFNQRWAGETVAYSAPVDIHAHVKVMILEADFQSKQAIS